jgi:acyl dehydratase
VHAYAAAIGDTNSAYPSSADGADGTVAPPTFAAVYALGAGSGGLASAGIAPWRLIHGEQQFSWTRAIKVGETLTAHGRIAEVYRKRNLQFVVAETRVTDAAGEEVCVSRSTVLVLPEEGRPAAGGNGA